MFTLLYTLLLLLSWEGRLNRGDLLVPGLLDLRPVCEEFLKRKFDEKLAKKTDLLSLFTSIEIVGELLAFGQCPLVRVQDLVGRFAFPVVAASSGVESD